MLLSRILPEVAGMHPTKYAMKHKEETLTYDALLDNVSRVARGLVNLRMRPGDRIALLGNPSPYLAIAECAAVAIGAIPVAVFPGLAPAEIKQIIQDAGPAAVVYDSDPNISALIPSLGITHCISCTAESASASIQSFILNQPLLTEWHEADPDDVAIIIYTGGTTGRSKGVMHSHRSIGSWAFMNPELGGGHNANKIALVPNQAHLTGQFVLWTSLFEGGCLIYADSYPLQAEQVVAIIEREQMKFLGTVGLLFRDIVDLLDADCKSMPSLEGVSCGGAPVGERTFLRARRVFPNARLTAVYSQTESGNFISIIPIDSYFAEGKRSRLLSVGKPADLALWGQTPFHVRIVDDAGNDVGNGGIGEIIVQGGQMMLGYWNNPQETDNAIRNGWLHTGDLGRFDEDGYLYLLDRKKDIIIVNGANVYCSEVEEVLGNHHSIRELAIIGTPLDDDGEEVTAMVVLHADAGMTIDEVKRFCRDRIATFKIPTRLEIVEAIPRTPVGKLNKAVIRERYWMGKTRMIN